MIGLVAILVEYPGIFQLCSHPGKQQYPQMEEDSKNTNVKGDWLGLEAPVKDELDPRTYVKVSPSSFLRLTAKEVRISVCSLSHDGGS